jgi:biopolymer transport protein ExbB
LLILLLMSMGSWYVIVTKTLEQNKLTKEAQDAQARFWLAASSTEGLGALPADGAYHHVVSAGLAAAEKHPAVAAEMDLKTWLSNSIERALGQVQSRLQASLSLLATVGSTSPFVGLFGTVWGIYNALVKIGTSGQASIDKVAGPVGEALIMTAIGLAVAVPAVLGYNWLVRRNKAALEQLRDFGFDLHAQLLAKK